MDNDAIVNYVDERGIGRRKPGLREILTEEQVEQIRYARAQGVTWEAIARYFRDEHGIDYGKGSFRLLLHP